MYFVLAERHSLKGHGPERHSLDGRGGLSGPRFSFRLSSGFYRGITYG